METVLAEAAPDDRAPPAIQHVDQLLTEPAPGEAVQVEVDGVVGVEQEERDGFERHQKVGQIRVDVSGRENEPRRSERGRENQPGKRDDQQHRRHLIYLFVDTDTISNI